MDPQGLSINIQIAPHELVSQGGLPLALGGLLWHCCKSSLLWFDGLAGSAAGGFRARAVVNEF